MTAQDIYEKCFTRVWVTLKENYEEKEVELITSLDTGADSSVDITADKLQKILQHLLKVALVQTLRGTEVRVSVGAANKQIVLTVRDHGPGMELAQINGLYELQVLEQLGAKCQISSRKFSDFPDNHGTQITAIC